MTTRRDPTRGDLRRSSPGGLLATCALVLLSAPALLSGQSADEAAVSGVLDALHQAASDADFERYFGLYAEDFIFLGTDATERWDRAQFMEYARGPFSQGRGWTYTMTERHVYVAADGRTAWFDERLDNDNLGETRGSGALVKGDDGWKITQYNLTIPVPNELAREFVARIREVAGGGR
ncbi:MAG: nuclear transport factor 2 family protein [Gemmatimonadota bacterium]|nr:nuclear transport factor 2 family protein [Gemmatimonadota bacterium]